MTRAWNLPNYRVKATLYISNVRLGRELPSLIVQDPLHPTQQIFFLSNFKTGQSPSWFTGTCLYYMRGLEFRGLTTHTRPSKQARLQYIWQQFGIDQASTAHRDEEPGASVYFQLARLIVLEKMRLLGSCLRRRGLVAPNDAGQFMWLSACDVFSDLTWQFPGMLPMASGGSIFPAAPPGYLLPGVPGD